jgi:hypothetical protein
MGSKKVLRAGEREPRPSGAIFHEVRRRPQVSEEFLASLAKDGVSEETIRSIERDNARDSESDDIPAHRP